MTAGVGGRQTHSTIHTRCVLACIHGHGACSASKAWSTRAAKVAVLGVACTLVLAWVVCTVIPLFARFAVVGSEVVWRTQTRVLATSLVFTDCEVMAVILCRAAHSGFCLTPTALPPLPTRTDVSTRLVLAHCFVSATMSN